MYKVAVIALCLVLAGLQYRLWLADGGYAEVHRLETKVTELTDRTRDMRKRNKALAAEIADLKSGVAAMEGRARSDLGMVKSGEQFYLLNEHD